MFITAKEAYSYSKIANELNGIDFIEEQIKNACQNGDTSTQINLDLMFGYRYKQKLKTLMTFLHKMGYNTEIHKYIQDKIGGPFYDYLYISWNE